MAQSQIIRTLRNEASVARIATILSGESFHSRSAPGRRVCEGFPFFDARGRPQPAGCLKAPATLADSIPPIVPPPQGPAVDRRPRPVEGGVPAPEDVPSHPSKIRDLRTGPVVTARTGRCGTP